MGYDPAIRQFQSMYQKLLGELLDLKKARLPLLPLAEKSFQASYRAWQEAESLAVSLPMRVGTILDWNRKIRPCFIAELEYALLLHHAALFLPSCPTRALKFWRREALRGNSFNQQHADLIAYLHSGEKDRELHFFGRPYTNYFPGALVENQMDGPVVLGRLKALRRYEPFVQNKIKCLLRS